MALLDELVSKIEDTELRRSIEVALKAEKKQKRFGLVFEEHFPENTPLSGLPVHKGSQVALKADPVGVTYIVTSINGELAECVKKGSKRGEKTSLPLKDLVCASKFGDPIYPYLEPLSSVCNAPDDDLWHVLIEADNYHALQLLEYLYAGKVDCIYIDPPYNSGATDWKYNNNYVDGTDAYRHSKWLSFMEKRLKLARKLLNPKDSVLIVTIDEREYLHLGCLLEEMFPEADIQMVSCAINPKGVARSQSFGRTDEYIYFVKFGNSAPVPLKLPSEWISGAKNSTRFKVRWASLLRTGTNGTRAARPNCFYPVFVSKDGKKFLGAGDPPALNVDRRTVPLPLDVVTVWPIHADGSEGCWGLGRETCLSLQKEHFVRLGGFTKNGMSIYYLKTGERNKVKNGIYKVVGVNEGDNSYILDDSDYKPVFVPGTQWAIPLHSASEHGSGMLRHLFGSKIFDFPKSLYATHDTIRFFVANKPNALILDFFAGSGTTLHAVNLLNTEDGGHRRCILVTNNEVSAEEEKMLRKAGHSPGDPEWEGLGIARHVTWPRTVYTITGRRSDGMPIEGEYSTTNTREVSKSRSFKQIIFPLTTPVEKRQFALLVGLPQKLAEGPFIVSEDHPASVLFDVSKADDWLDALDGQSQITDLYIVTGNRVEFDRIRRDAESLLGDYTISEPEKRPMSEGFKANAAFFKLGFLNRDSVSLGWNFREMVPTLWMKAGCCGPCPSLPEGVPDPEMLVCPDNRFAVLLQPYSAFLSFEREVNEHPEISTLFVVIDSESDFRRIADTFPDRESFQLYGNYLESFTINCGRNR